MNRDWQAFLSGHGAVIEGQRVVHFGDPAREAEALDSGCVIADLSHWGVIAAAGEDAAAFLQGQLTNDIRRVSEQAGQISGYCNAKGRLLALFYVTRQRDAYCLCLPEAPAAPVIERLEKFKLRARLQLRDAGQERTRVGLAGHCWEEVLESTLGAVPREEYATVQRGSLTALRLPGAMPRFLALGEQQEIRELWPPGGGIAVPVGASPWQLLDIRAGVPAIVPATQERFVPQMVNLDALHGISLKKGCYAGQEIVARMHYLGRLKQRMYPAVVDGAGAVRPGDLLYSAGGDGRQSTGTVVAAQPAPGHGRELLAVINIEAAQRGDVHLHGPEGPQITIGAPPYPLDSG